MPKDDSSKPPTVAFPAGAGMPHQYDNWTKWLKNAVIDDKLLDISTRRVPDGKFKALHSPNNAYQSEPPQQISEPEFDV